MPRRFAVMVLPFFAAERVLRSHEERQLPAILVAMMRNRREVMAVSSSSYARGIRAGMTATAASAIRPDVRVLDHDPAGDEDGMRTLAKWIQRYSPRVGRWQTPDAKPDEPPRPGEPACLWADITGCERIFGGEWPLAARIANDLRDLGYSSRVALGGTIMGARAVALAGKTPTHAHVIPDGGLTAALAGLPVNALPLPDRTLQMLTDLAIVTIGQLCEIPRQSIVARFGQRTLKIIDEAHGRLPDRLPAESLDEPLAIELPLPAPTDRQDALVFLLRQMVNALGEQLAGMARGVTRLVLSLSRSSDEEPPAIIDLQLTEPQRDADELFQLLRERLERVDLGVPVDGMLLVAHETDGLTDEQATLFVGDRRRHQALGTLVDRMRERLGDPAVLRATLAEHHLPEHAARWHQVLHADTRPPAVVPPLPVRPPVLLESPVAVALRDAARADHAEDGATFMFERRDYRVLWRSGPERIVAAWWDADTAALRDYYTLHTEQGPVFWCYREPATSRWFVHGLFD